MTRLARLAVAVPAAGQVTERAPEYAAGGYAPRLPGLGARYLSGLERELQALGWAPIESHGLLAAAEERCGLWLVTPRRISRRARVRAWRGGRFLDAPGGLSDLAAACTSAPGTLAVCLAAVMGGGEPPRGLIGMLAANSVPVGRVSAGPESGRRARWAVEVLVAPSLGASVLAGLRERVAAAPRCAWCHTPVLGSACTRCRGGAA